MQIQSLERLGSGTSISATAKIVGVDRSTIHRWLREHFGFRAAVNATRLELQQAVDLRLAHTAATAAEVVAKVVENGDLRAAITVLKGMGALSSRQNPPGSDCPNALADEAIIKDAIRRDRRLLFGAIG